MDREDIIHLERQTNIVSHRGPDQSGYFTEGNVCFGFRRLSIIDLESGDQPLTYDDGRCCIVFNGEIYNYIELRNRLEEEGFVFSTDSDTEVILALYLKDKENVLRDLRGMFAFVIWDKIENRLFAARDPFGIKPFYYMETEEGLQFASEKKSLLLGGRHDTSPNDQEAFQHYFTYQFVPEPMTLSKHIKRLEPGCYLTKQPNAPIEIKSYWKPFFKPSSDSIERKVSAIRAALSDSVKLHMRSDVPVGAFLSGGIDSTAITALARENHPGIQTFSVGFEQEGFSETTLAAETAEKLGVQNHRKIISAEEFMEELPNIIWHLDDPVADPAAVPLYFVAREASKHVKVILSGEGADELFGGYNIYREPLALKWFSLIPGIGRKWMGRIANKLPEDLKGRNFLIRGCTPLKDRYIGNAKMFEEDEKRLLLRHYDENIHFTQMTHPLYENVKDYHEMTKMQYIDLHTWLRGDILMKADKMTMAHSLELRVPFLDKEVFKTAAGLSVEEKTFSGTTKYALRKAMEGIVPDPVLYRRKLGFPVPIRHWLKNEMYDWARKLIRESGIEEYVNKTEALKLLEAHRQGKGDQSRKIWTVLTFIIWYRVFAEQDDPSQWEKEKEISRSG